jgi:hypothetical protein
MARNTEFHVWFNKDNPGNDGPGPDDLQFKDPANPSQRIQYPHVNNMTELMSLGRLTALGHVYSARSGDIQTDSQPSSAETMDTHCVIVYIGGTAYKIC